jgi:hypothetical protein
MTRRDDELSPAELEQQDATALPDREAMSTLDPTAGLDPSVGLPTGPLLDLDVNVDAALDLAAPVNAAVAANANAALPIDAAVSANALSPGAESIAQAQQTSVIGQSLDGTAIADSDQTSNIEQGETPPVTEQVPPEELSGAQEAPAVDEPTDKEA